MTKTRSGLLIASCLVLLSFGACDSGGGTETPSGEDASSTEGPSTEQLNTLAATLRNAATAEETYAAENFTYTSSVADLEAVGLNVPSDHELEIVSASETEYCLQASIGEATMFIESGATQPIEGTC